MERAQNKDELLQQLLKETKIQEPMISVKDQGVKSLNTKEDEIIKLKEEISILIE